VVVTCLISVQLSLILTGTDMTLQTQIPEELFGT